LVLWADLREQQRIRGLRDPDTGPEVIRAAGERAGDAARRGQCDILREMFGNPFRDAALAPSWLTPAVVGLASFIYEEHAFDRLPGLADILEARGWTDADLLSHCRGPGPHTRGCWVVDLVLGKE
jgi:hypothetical protein